MTRLHRKLRSLWLGITGRIMLTVCLLLAPYVGAHGADGDRVHAHIPGLVPVAVEASRITRAPSGKIHATGGVVISRGDDTLHASEATYDPATDEIEAVGDVRLFQPGRRLTSERLRYGARTGEILGTDIRAALASKAPRVEYHFQGESLSGSPEEYHLHGGLFTTCEQHPPHFGLRAREITYIPGDRVRARRVSLLFLGTPIITLPSYTLDLTDDRDKPGLFPQLVLGATDGIGVRGDLRLPMPDRGGLHAYAILSARHTLRGGLGIYAGESIPLGIRAGFKEAAPTRFASGLTVSVLPAITFHLPELSSPSPALQLGMARYQPTFDTLANDVTGGGWSGDKRYRLLFAGSAGRYTEHPTDVSDNRLNLTGAFEVRPFQAFEKIELGAALRGRLAYYGGGSHYGVVSPEINAQWSPSKRHLLRAEFRHQIARGSTPFLFDRIDAERNLNLTWRTRSAMDAIELAADIDLDNRSLYNWSVGYSRRVDCLQPGLTLHRRGEDWGIGVTLEIPGLTGGF